MLNIGVKVRANWCNSVEFIGEITDFAYESHVGHAGENDKVFGPYVFVVPSDPDSVPAGLRNGVYVGLDCVQTTRAPLIDETHQYDTECCEFCGDGIPRFKHYNHAKNHYAKHHDVAI